MRSLPVPSRDGPYTSSASAAERQAEARGWALDQLIATTVIETEDRLHVPRPAPGAAC